MSRIAAVCSALPPHRHQQSELAAATAEICAVPESRRALIDRLYANAGVATRHTVLPLADYKRLDGVGPTNDLYIEHATVLGSQAVRATLEKAGVEPRDIDLFVVTSVTGVAVPSLDARLVPLLGLRPDVKRVPMFGLGCVAGAAGLARVHDYLLAYPQQTALLLSVELCSLSVPLGDATTADFVGSALFGDGAAAVVVQGSLHHHDRGDPRVVATRSVLCPDSEEVLGWRLGSQGFRIILTAELAEVVARHIGDVVRGFLADHDLRTTDIAQWICHPGGPKVVDAVRDGLGLDEAQMAATRASLAEVGNLSSASVLHVLEKTLGNQDAPSGPALIIGLGPGVSIELILLER